MEGGAHAVPAGEHDAGLGPGEDPGDGPQVGDGGGLFAGCWSGSDVEVADFGQGGGGGEVFDEAGVVVDQVGVFGLAEFGDFPHDGVGLLRVGLPLFDFEEGRFDGGGDEGFEVAAGGFGGAVFRGDDFALFGDADCPVDGAFGLGEDGVVGGAAAAADGAAPAVEEAEGDVVVLGGGYEVEFGVVKGPVGGEVAAVFVGVGVAEHDFLHIAALFQIVTVEGDGPELFDDVGAGLEVFDGFEEGDDVDGAGGVVAVGVDEAEFFEEHHGFEQVGDGLGHGDDGVGYHTGPEVVDCLFCGGDEVEFALGGFAEGVGVVGDERPGAGEFGGEEGDFFGFVEAAVVGVDVGVGEDFGEEVFVAFGVLPQVHGVEVEAEGDESGADAAKPVVGDDVVVVGPEGFVDDGKVGEYLVGGLVGGVVGVPGSFYRVVADEGGEGGDDAAADAVDGTPVGFIDAGGNVVVALFREFTQFVGDVGEPVGEGEFVFELVEFLFVVFEDGFRGPGGGIF